ncbi:MAG: zinc ribbon domain-containing protein [Fusicatenibacter sp.]|nr:zinc ribbon domain-containing protein [Fusicatenibacter sp.]
MYCPNCGAKLPDQSKYCGSCGVKLSDFLGATAETSEVQETWSDDSTPAKRRKQPVSVKPEKKTKRKLIVGAAAAAVVVIVGIAVKVGLSVVGRNDNAYVYLSDGKYELLTSLKQDEAIEIAASKSDAAESYLLSFSPDGEYVYYYTKYDASFGTGSLCRAEYGKLKEHSGKNDNYIDVIATNVRLGFRFLEDGTVTYVSGEDTLYCYDGKESTQIAKSVNNYYTDGSSRIVYEAGSYTDGYTMYGIDLNEKDNKIKLAADYGYVYDAVDFDHIFYTREDEDYNESLYVVGFEKDSEKLGDNVNVFYAIDGVTYFTAANGTSLTLYDYVEDPYESADSGIVEPDIEEYGIPTYRYYALDSNSDPEDYEQIYTSCTNDVYFLWYGYSMEEYVERYSSDEHISDYQAFIDKYKSLEDENGYLVVTDAVKNDLIALAQTNGQGYDGEWLEFCFYKEQNGTSYDYDSYYADYEKYEEAADRIEMREALQSKDNAFAVQTLYCYNKGKLTAISENVLQTRFCYYGIMYNTTDLVTDTIALENVSSVFDVTDLFSMDNEAQNYLVSTADAGTAAIQMSKSAAETFAEAYESSYAVLYLGDSNVYMNDSNGGFYAASVNKGTVGSFQIITDDAEVSYIDGSTVYYISGEYTSNDCVYCDLYSYSDGKKVLLAQDVLFDDINLYSDGTILAYTGYHSNYGYELTAFSPDGSKNIIADDVTLYIRVDPSTLLYIADDDLYLYDGKEKTMICSDVDWLWSQKKMEIQNSFGWYSYYYD